MRRDKKNRMSSYLTYKTRDLHVYIVENGEVYRVKFNVENLKLGNEESVLDSPPGYYLSPARA